MASSPHAWGEPLTDDASIRDYNGGIGCQVASALEETLLLPKRHGGAARIEEERGLPPSQAMFGDGMYCYFIIINIISFTLLFFYFFIFKPPSFFFFF